MGKGRTLKASDYGPSFVLETPEPLSENVGRLYTTTLDPLRGPRKIPPGFSPVDYHCDQVRRVGVTGVALRGGPFSGFGELDLHVAAPRHPTFLPNYHDLFDSLPNQSDFHYAAVLSFKHGPSAQMLASEDRTAQIPPDAMRLRRQAFFGILRTWIRELRAHFVWGDGEFRTLKKHEAEDSRLRVWGYNFYSARLVQAIGRDRFAALAATGAWAVEDFEGGVLLLGNPDPLTVSGAEKAKAAKVLRLRERLGPLLPPKLPRPDPDPRPPPPKGVVE